MSIKFSTITVNIPAYNEEARIGKTVSEIKKYFSNVLVIDDGSQDDTKLVAKKFGAIVIDNQYEKGYLGATKTGFHSVNTDWIVTVDADGEHRIQDIIGISKFALSHNYDLVIGTRKIVQISRPSEIILSGIASIKSPIFDTGSGLRAIKTELAKKMELFGKCVCGTFVIEAMNRGASIGEFPIVLRKILKPSSIAWQHFQQFFILLFHLIISKGNIYYEK